MSKASTDAPLNHDPFVLLYALSHHAVRVGETVADQMLRSHNRRCIEIIFKSPISIEEEEETVRSWMSELDQIICPNGMLWGASRFFVFLDYNKAICSKLLALEEEILALTPPVIRVEMETRMLRVMSAIRDLAQSVHYTDLAPRPEEDFRERTDKWQKRISECEEATWAMRRLMPPSEEDKRQLGELKGATAERKAGRKQKYDPKEDEALKAAWDSGQYKLYADLEKERGLSEGDVERAFARLRGRSHGKAK